MRWYLLHCIEEIADAVTKHLKCQNCNKIAVTTYTGSNRHVHKRAWEQFWRENPNFVRYKYGTYCSDRCSRRNLNIGQWGTAYQRSSEEQQWLDDPPVGKEIL